MKFMGKLLFLAACVAVAQSSAPVQSVPAAPAAGSDASPLATLVKQQFGSTFTIPAKFATPIVADFDGDGVEDVAIVADSKEPFPDSYAFKYQVGDPYNAYFGMNNPQVSAAFHADPEHSHHVLIIFGSGAEGWHAATPKAKFVLIDLPFDSLEVGRLLVSKKKPPIFVIKAHEAQIMESAVWWDAKKKRWKWLPGDTVE